MRVRSSAVLAVAAVLLVAGPMVGFGVPLSAAMAEPDSTVVLVADDETVDLAEDDDGKVTGSLTLINNTTGTPTVTAEHEDQDSTCKIEPGPTSLDASREQKVTLTFTSCRVDEAFEFTVTVGEIALPTLTTKPPDEPNPAWLGLLGFVGTAVIGALVIGLTYRTWDGKPAPASTPAGSAADTTEPTSTSNLLGGLPGLPATWSFKESWATNATVIAAAFTGVIGVSDIADTLFADDADDVVALVAVGSAIAIGLVGAAPMTLQMLRNKAGEATPLGIIVAGIVTVSATGGELIAAIVAALNAGLGGTVGSWALVVAGTLALIVLGAYSSRATIQNLRTGVTPPPKDAKKIVIEIPVLSRLGEEDRRLVQDLAAQGQLSLPPATYQVEYEVETAAPTAGAALL